MLIGSALKDDIERIILYGSCVRGQEKYTSDVDIAVVLRDKPKQEYSYVVRDVRDQILKRVDYDPNCADLDLNFYTNTTYSTSHMFYFHLLRKEGVVLWSKPTKLLQTTITNI